MSNFWFNEDAFLRPQTENNDDFIGSIFDDLGEQSQSGGSSQPFSQQPMGDNSPYQQLQQLPPQPPQQPQNQHQQQPQQIQPQQMQRQPPPPQQYPQTMPPQQMQIPPQKNPSQSSLMLDGIFDNQDQHNLGGYPQQPQQNPNLIGRQGAGSQPEVMGPQHQQPPLDKAKQEQLMKMRLQIMQQQMLQRQQPSQQQLPSMPQQIIPQYQQNRILPNMGYDTSSIGQQQQNSGQNYIYNDGRKSGPSGTIPNLQMLELIGPASLSSPALGTNGPYGTSGPTPMVNPQTGGQGMQKIPFKPTPAQISQLQHDLFTMSLNDFMTRKGTPMGLPPTIGNKRVNLLALQILSRKIGGSTAVLNHLKVLSQPSPQFTEWSNICEKLGLFENIDVKTNILAKQQVEKQLATYYLQYILPYEQYALTKDGQKDLQGRRVQFQKQLLMRMQQQYMQQQQQQQLLLGQSQHQQSMQNPQSQGSNSAVQQQGGPSQTVNSSLQYNSPSMLVNRPGSGPHQVNNQAMKARMPGVGPDVSQSPIMGQKGAQFQSPTMPNLSPHPSMIPTPNAMANPSPSMSNANTLRKMSQHSLSNHNSPALIQSPHVPNSISRSSSVHQKPNFHQNTALESFNGTPKTQEEEAPPGKPNTIKKYTPIKKVADSQGFFLKKVSELGDEIEVLKPVYLFAPELGALNLHALTMSLKNYSASNEGEAFSALNTLLVTTADDNFKFDLSEAPELLAALVGLGQKVLSRITKRNVESKAYYDIKEPSDNSIDSVFNKYVPQLTIQGEDVAFVVDSLTGDMVVDDESDLEIDEIFSPVATETETEFETTAEEPEEAFECNVPDYMAAMHAFRSENKHHFSKLQTKGPVDEQVFLVDSLITVSMTLRNLSLAQDSAGVMAKSVDLSNLVFAIIKQVATKPEAFVFQRKRLCLLKDCLILFNHHGPFIEIQSLEQAFLTFLLVSGFGPNLNQDEDKPDSQFAMVSAPLDHYTYLPYAVDVFTKLLVREPKNRAYFQAVLTGTLNISFSASNPGSDSVTILPADHQETKKLISAYFGGDLTKLKQGVLLTRAYKLLMSSVPYNVSGSEFSKAIFSHLPSILQALFGSKLLIDLVSSDEINANMSWILLKLLTTNMQAIVFNFTKSVFGLIAESIKISRSSGEHKIAVFVSIKALIMINSLFANAVKLNAACNEGEIEDLQSFMQEVLKLSDLYRIQQDADFLLNSLSVSGVDPDLPEQVMRLRRLVSAIRESV